VTPGELADAAKRIAAATGFEACGIANLAPSRTADALNAWLERGFHGEMKYMARQAAVRRDPARAWREARSIVVVLHNYYRNDSTISADRYRLARYAQGEDYHQVTMSKLERLGSEIVRLADHGSYRSYVDAGPLPERELAQRAGLGWMAKNTMLIHPRLGSFTFIGCVLTDLELEADSPFEADRCGSCTRCLDACPTGAFPEPHVLDATRCISYLTIEARSDVPAALRASVGEHLFGCDICQEVCPWNVRFAQDAAEPGFRPAPDTAWPTLEEIAAMDQAAFDNRFGDTAIKRAGVSGLQRNARVVLENRSR